MNTTTAVRPWRRRRKGHGMIRMDIQTVVVGAGPVASLVVLRPRGAAKGDTRVLPIRIGTVEASSIGMGIDATERRRPMTHDLLRDVIASLGATVTGINVRRVEGTTFFAEISITDAQGTRHTLDSRPSDAIALAVRTKAPVYVSEEVMQTASYPDFGAVEKDEESKEVAEFHDFVEGLTPDDFSQPDRQS